MNDYLRCPAGNPAARRAALARFAASAYARTARVLALVRWSRGALRPALDARRVTLDVASAAAARLEGLRELCGAVGRPQPLRAPAYAVPAALEVLETGRFGSLPRVMDGAGASAASRPDAGAMPLPAATAVAAGALVRAVLAATLPPPPCVCAIERADGGGGVAPAAPGDPGWQQCRWQLVMRADAEYEARLTLVADARDRSRLAWHVESLAATTAAAAAPGELAARGGAGGAHAPAERRFVGAPPGSAGAAWLLDLARARVGASPAAPLLALHRLAHGFAVRAALASWGAQAAALGPEATGRNPAPRTARWGLGLKWRARAEPLALLLSAWGDSCGGRRGGVDEAVLFQPGVFGWVHVLLSIDRGEGDGGCIRLRTLPAAPGARAWRARACLESRALTRGRTCAADGTLVQAGGLRSDVETLLLDGLRVHAVAVLRAIAHFLGCATWAMGGGGRDGGRAGGARGLRPRCELVTAAAVSAGDPRLLVDVSCGVCIGVSVDAGTGRLRLELVHEGGAAGHPEQRAVLARAELAVAAAAAASTEPAPDVVARRRCADTVNACCECAGAGAADARGGGGGALADLFALPRTVSARPQQRVATSGPPPAPVAAPPVAGGAADAADEFAVAGAVSLARIAAAAAGVLVEAVSDVRAAGLRASAEAALVGAGVHVARASRLGLPGAAGGGAPRKEALCALLAEAAGFAEWLCVDVDAAGALLLQRVRTRSDGRAGGPPSVELDGGQRAAAAAPTAAAGAPPPAAEPSAVARDVEHVYVPPVTAGALEAVPGLAAFVQAEAMAPMHAWRPVPACAVPVPSGSSGVGDAAGGAGAGGVAPAVGGAAARGRKRRRTGSSDGAGFGDGDAVMAEPPAGALPAAAGDSQDHVFLARVLGALGAARRAATLAVCARVVKSLASLRGEAVRGAAEDAGSVTWCVPVAEGEVRLRVDAPSGDGAGGWRWSAECAGGARVARGGGGGGAMAVLTEALGDAVRCGRGAALLRALAGAGAPGARLDENGGVLLLRGAASASGAALVATLSLGAASPAPVCDGRLPLETAAWVVTPASPAAAAAARALEAAVNIGDGPALAAACAAAFGGAVEAPARPASSPPRGAAHKGRGGKSSAR